MSSNKCKSKTNYSNKSEYEVSHNPSFFSMSKNLFNECYKKNSENIKKKIHNDQIKNTNDKESFSNWFTSNIPNINNLNNPTNIEMKDLQKHKNNFNNQIELNEKKSSISPPKVNHAIKKSNPIFILKPLNIQRKNIENNIRNFDNDFINHNSMFQNGQILKKRSECILIPKLTLVQKDINIESNTIYKDSIINNTDRYKIHLEIIEDETKNDLESLQLNESENDTEKKKLNEIIQINKKFFHNDEFRGQQLKAIKSALNNDDVFVLMPTGGGKSLCYQLPGVMQGGLTVIISPLISLIEDQIRRLNELKLNALYLSRNLSKDQYFDIIHKMKTCQINFLFITPEKLTNSKHLQENLSNLFNKNQLTRFVIDEAHCISQWGHDFRPDYLKLNILREKYPSVPIMALTATATENVQNDIINYLKITKCMKIQQSFKRPNIFLQVNFKQKDIHFNCQLMISWITNHQYKDETGIVFCTSRNETELISDLLKKYHFKASFYHAAMPDKKRSEVQSKWLNGELKIIVATTAFGMGIDKPDVRFVIHYSIPKSLEEYYQEIGRSGRDGKKSHCLLLFNVEDIDRTVKIIWNNDIGEVIKQKQFLLLVEMVKYAIQTRKCRHYKMLKYFGDHSISLNCNKMCDNCNHNDRNSFDLTDHAKNIARIIEEINRKRKNSPYPTNEYVYQVYIGSTKQNIVNSGDSKLEEAGKGIKLKKHKIIYDFILLKLWFKKVIIKKCISLEKAEIVIWEPDQNMNNFLTLNEIQIQINRCFFSDQ